MVERSVPKLHTEWNPPEDVGIDCSVEPSMTQQNFKDECDINNIMARYETTGLIEFRNDVESGRYLDLASAVDFHTAQNLVIAAQDAFMSIPPDIRAKFDNDAAKFLAFVEDPKNAQALVDLGLATSLAATAAQAAPAPSGADKDSSQGAGSPKDPQAT